MAEEEKKLYSEEVAEKYGIDTSDPLAKAALNEGKALLDEATNNANTMIDNANAAYESAKTGLKDVTDEQIANQKAANELAVQKLETEKANAKKDYEKEQSGAYADYQKQIQQHGANAEQMASMGMGGTGYSETVRASMYNQYQTRVATAREAFVRANADYDAAIAEAKLQGSVALAEIAYKSYEQKTQLALEQLQYGNSLLNTLTEQKASISNNYWQRYLEVMSAKDGGSGSDPLSLEDFLVTVEGSGEGLVEPVTAGTKTGSKILQGLSMNSNNIYTQLNTIPSTKTNPTSELDPGRLANAGLYNLSANIDEQIASAAAMIDVDSIEALGIPNITEEKLIDYINKGYVEEYTVKTLYGNKIKYRFTEKGRKKFNGLQRG